MKVKLIKPVQVSKFVSAKVGEIFKVRHYPDGTLLNLNRPFQVIDGQYSGLLINRDACIEVEEEKQYTEAEWNELKEHYVKELNKEKGQAALFQSLARELTVQIKQKNKELERANFFIDALSVALKASSEAIETLRGQKVH